MHVLYLIYVRSILRPLYPDISAVNRLIHKNSHIKVKEISEELSISIGSVYSIVHKEH
jgi:predicted transcriptional regulator